MVRYACRQCGSEEVQGTLPAWFTVNTFTPAIGSLGPAYDGDAEWGYGWCPGCDASGQFLDVAARATLEPMVAAVGFEPTTSSV